MCHSNISEYLLNPNWYPGKIYSYGNPLYPRKPIILNIDTVIFVYYKRNFLHLIWNIWVLNCFEYMFWVFDHHIVVSLNYKYIDMKGNDVSCPIHAGKMNVYLVTLCHSRNVLHKTGINPLDKDVNTRILSWSSVHTYSLRIREA